MCGIAGTFSRVASENLNIKDVVSTLIKRGPDGSRTAELRLVSGKIIRLAFSRLAIIDLNERSMQPLKFGNYMILMNGEIYNYKQLKRDIEEKYGIQEWETSGDTEVALRHLHFNGIEAARDFDGMFAIAILDIHKERVFLIRDFFGEKPLFYLLESDSLHFASEPKAIWKFSNKIANINIRKLVNFVVNGYKGIYKDNQEFFDSLCQVQPGEILEFSAEKLLSRKSIFPKNASSFSKSKKSERASVVDRVKKAVIKSVGLRLESDVPLSICLSGGVDSGLVAAIAKKEYGVSLHAYTLISQDKRYSELETSRIVADYLKLDHELVKIDNSNFLQRLQTLIQYHEAPISTISYYVQSFLMKKIHEDGFKVSLMGTGADEIFTGYYDHHLLYLYELWRSNHSIYRSSLKLWQNEVLPLVRNPIFRNANLYIEQPGHREHVFEGSAELRNLSIVVEPDRFSENQYSTSMLRNRMLNELFHEVVPVILKEDDRNSMFYSIENRSPFLSVDLLNECSSIEDFHLINQGRTKSLLREAFDGYLPESVLYSRRKIGFNASFLELCDINSAEFTEFIADDSTFWEYINKGEVQKVFNSIELKDLYNKAAFNIVSAKLFYEEFNQA